MKQKFDFTVCDVHFFGERTETGGSIASNGRAEDTEENQDYNAAIDGIESLILGHACAGIDVSAPAYIKGVESALEGITENL